MQMNKLTTTSIFPPFKVEVVTNQAIMPAPNPMRLPQMQPFLLAFDQVTPRAMGTTAEPRITPINVLGIAERIYQI
jgi:hypothetical protein